MYVSICVHSNPYYVASCSPRPSFSATMTDAGTHALLKKWADDVALRTVHRGVYSPNSTRTVSWPSLENCAWSTLDTPVALVKLTHPGVAQPHSLTDPLLSLFDNNPNLQAIVLQLHDSDARAFVEHVKKNCGGPNRGMSLYLREWEMQDGSPGIHVSGDVAAGWRMGCSVLGRGAEPPQFWVLLIWLEPGISHVTWVHYDATMCLPCFVCSILPVLHFLRFDLCVL